MANLTYRQVKSVLDITWNEQTEKVRVLAARYYAGIDTYEDLRRLAQPTEYGRFQGNSTLTASEAYFITMMR